MAPEMADTVERVEKFETIWMTQLTELADIAETFEKGWPIEPRVDTCRDCFPSPKCDPKLSFAHWIA